MLAHLVRRTTTPQGLVRRAGTVLAAEGANNQQIADRLGFDRETVRLWRGRWLEARERLAAAEEAAEKKLRRCIENVLDDAPRSGGPPTFTPEQICSIVALACEDPRDSGRAVTHWTSPELADEAIKRGIVQSISPRSVGRFLGRGGSQAASDALLDAQRTLGRAGGL
jgi:putative transposase